MNSLGFVGGGRITRIFFQAFQNRNVAVSKVVVSDPNEELLAKLKADFASLNVVTGSNLEVASQDIVFLAVHPPVMKEVLPEIADAIQSAQIVVSLAPVFTSQKLEAMLNGYNKLVRMIPNAASIINSGYNPVWYADYIDETEKNLLGDLFAALGDSPEVEESKLEAYAIITAMGPTYLWPQLNELHKLGLEFGLSEKELCDGIKALVTNTIDLLYDSDLDYDDVVDLIPIKPLGESEQSFREIYKSKLTGLYNKLTGK